MKRQAHGRSPALDGGDRDDTALREAATALAGAVVTEGAVVTSGGSHGTAASRAWRCLLAQPVRTGRITPQTKLVLTRWPQDGLDGAAGVQPPLTDVDAAAAAADAGIPNGDVGQPHLHYADLLPRQARPPLPPRRVAVVAVPLQQWPWPAAPPRDDAAAAAVDWLVLVPAAVLIELGASRGAQVRR